MKNQILQLIGGADLLARGVTNLSMLRPVLGIHEDPMASNATLRHEEWLRVDARVNEVARERHTIVDDLRSRGLVAPVSLGTILRMTERIDDFDPAEITFDGDTAPRRDQVNYRHDIIPVPIISKEFQIGWRQLDASRTRGEPLDVTSAGLAARKVQDMQQRLAVYGYGAGPDGSSIPGIITAANRRTVNLTVDWDESGADPVGDVNRMLDEAYSVNLFGPFVIYLPKNYWAQVQNDYSQQKGDNTILQRILAFEDVTAVRPLDALPDDNVVMIQMTSDVIEWSEAQAITTVQWQKNPFVTTFRVLSVGGPHIKNMESAATGGTITGIIHLRANP